MGRDIEGSSEWREMAGASDVRSCGCGAGAWADNFDQCHKCGDGIVCNGMGIVEVLPGYFARADDPGFVWQCHGPGGVPGTCADKRMNPTMRARSVKPSPGRPTAGLARCVRGSTSLLKHTSFFLIPPDGPSLLVGHVPVSACSLASCSSVVVCSKLFLILFAFILAVTGQGARDWFDVAGDIR